MNTSQSHMLERNRFSRIRQKLSKTIDVDKCVAQIVYSDTDGKLTERVVSLIRFDESDKKRNRFRAFCLGDGIPKNFLLDRIQSIELVPAHEVLMPVEIKELDRWQ